MIWAVHVQTSNVSWALQCLELCLLSATWGSSVIALLTLSMHACKSTNPYQIIIWQLENQITINVENSDNSSFYMLLLLTNENSSRSIKRIFTTEIIVISEVSILPKWIISVSCRNFLKKVVSTFWLMSLRVTFLHRQLGFFQIGNHKLLFSVLM